LHWPAGKILFSGSAELIVCFFYFAVVFIIYARMSQYRDLISESRLRRLRVKEPLIVEEEKRLDHRRNRYVTSCMTLFNCAIISLPISLLSLTERRWLQSLVIDLAVLIFGYSLWATRRRLKKLLVELFT
jgi:hypothetical protein